MNIETFEVRKIIDGSQVILHPTLLEVNNKKYLIDCGYEETFNEFVKGLNSLNTAITELYAVLVSHDDIDHLGALALFKEKHPGLLVYSGSVEASSVAGKEKSERLQQAENSFSSLPEDYKDWATRFITRLRNIKRVEVDRILEDSGYLEGEIEVIATPGHTKGHLSFYIPAQKTLIANDAVVVEENRFEIANPAFTLDLQQAVQSVKKLSTLQIDKLICYHGGMVESKVSERLSDLVNRYSSAK